MSKKIFNIIAQEERRQRDNIELIASENYVSMEILEAQGSILTNKYAEGYPGKRYYEGCANVDRIEDYAKEQLQKLFSTDYYANVQPHSGSNSNLSVYLAIMKIKKRSIRSLGMSLDAGGHLTHWAMPSFSGSRYGIIETNAYGVDEKGHIDFEEVQRLATEHKPDVIIAWASAYSQIIDFEAFKKIADSVGAYLWVDMAHIAGLVACGAHPTPFGYADFITSTTHKTLRGPRGGIIMSKDLKESKAVDSAVFPGTQGGPLMHVIAAKAICFEQAQSESFKKYIAQVVKNAKVLEEEIKKIIINSKQIKIVSGWTDNHLLLLDFRELGLSGKQVERNLEAVGITTNKNSVPWDKNPSNPSGLRIGSPAITSRGCDEKDMKTIVRIISDVLTMIYLQWEDLSEGQIKEANKDVLSLMKGRTITPKV